MKNYDKPIVLVNPQLAEGVYLASGDSCYSTSAVIHQRPEVGRGDYRIQINGKHNADHNCNGQILTISFNQLVKYSNSNGQLISGDNSNTLQIKYNYWNNHIDNIGFGDLVVVSEQGLAITDVILNDTDYRM